jgi:HEAT repeat protein
MTEETIFESAISILQSAASAQTGEDSARFPLAWLSDLGTAQIRKLAGIWPRLSVLYRRDLMSRMDEEARENFDLDFTAMARHALADEDPEVRGFAIRALWECDDIRLVSRFLQLLESDPDMLVRACAAEALGPFVERAEVEEVPAALRTRMEDGLIRVIRADEDLTIQCKAVESIGYSSHAEVPAIVRVAYRHPDERMRVSAVRAMGHTADPDWAGQVSTELKSRSAGMRAEAARAAGELTLREAVGALVELLEDPELAVRRNAIWSLGEIGGASALRALTKLRNRIEDDDEEADLIDEALDSAEFQDSLGDLSMLDQETGDEEDLSEEEDDFDDEESPEDED